MTDKKHSMNQQDFENLQRILAGHAPASLTIMGLTLTFAATGLAGAFAVATSTGINKGQWNTGLGFVMALIMGILWMVWSREHALGKQALDALETGGIVFPKTNSWKGATAKMWHAVFVVNTVGWALFAVGHLIAGVRNNAG